MTHTMPLIDTKLALIELNSYKDKHTTRLQNSTVWSGQLTSEQYALREHTLSKSAIAAGGLHVFKFVNQDDPDVFIGSVELLVRKSWKFVNGQDQPKDVLSGCIGGVHINNEFRGKGYARTMIDLLVKTARESLVGEDGFLFLYLEVGEYYTRNGFTSYEVPLTFVKLRVGDSAFDLVAREVSSQGYTYKPIQYHQFKLVYEEFNAVHKAKCGSLTNTDRKTRWAINPSSDFVDWFHLRSKYIAHHNHYSQVPGVDYHSATYEELVSVYGNLEPKVFGFELWKDGRRQGFISWTYEWTVNDDTHAHENYISLINLFSTDDDITVERALYRLAQAFLEQANLFSNRENDLRKISIWESEIRPELLAELQAQGASLGHANGLRSAILIFNETEHAELVAGKAVWELNTKLPWF